VENGAGQRGGKKYWQRDKQRADVMTNDKIMISFQPKNSASSQTLKKAKSEYEQFLKVASFFYLQCSCKGKVEISLLQAMEAHKVARG
jgi:hypothetical protein